LPRRRNRQPRFDSRDDLLDGAAATLDLHGSACAHLIADWSRDTDDGGFVVRLR
jgi:hypothetical protein